MYKVSELPTQGDSLNWIQIEPKAANDNNGFQIVMMGFNSQNQLKSMKFTDNFGNKTNLKFSNLQTGIKIPDSDFQFKIPAGVDVAEQ